MNNLVFIDERFINENTHFDELISKLDQGFSSNTTLAPLRHHHDFPNPKIGQDSTLLLMPAWNPDLDAGVKLVTVSPNNSQIGLSTINGTYIYFDAKNGRLKAIMDAKSLTVKRTAAASALASNYLSNQDASSLLIIGTGALSTNLIMAHTSIRPIKTVYVWGRNFDKADAICSAMKNEKFFIQPVRSIKEVISKVDIISCATLSENPLILGEYLRPGQHVDLVGAYKKDMREADDDTILKASIFLDTFQGGLKESGDIVIPLRKGILKKENIKADLFQLCSKQKVGRTRKEEITVFKSVGHAIEDLIAAKYYFNKFSNE